MVPVKIAGTNTNIEITQFLLNIFKYFYHVKTIINEKFMRIKIIFLCLFVAVLAKAQNSEQINVPGFGTLAAINKGGNFDVDFGKYGKFNFSGTISPLKLETKATVEQLKEFPGYKHYQKMGLRDIALKVSPGGLEMEANADTKGNLKNLCDALKISRPVIGVGVKISKEGFALNGALDFSDQPIVVEVIKDETRLTLQKLELAAEVGIGQEGFEDPTLSVKLESLIKPTKWDKDLKMVMAISYDLLTMEIKASGSMVDTWTNPFGLSNHFKKDVVVLNNTAISVGWIPGAPTPTTLGFYLEKAILFDLEFGMAMSISPASREFAGKADCNKISMNNLTGILREGFNLKVPDVFPDNVFIEDAMVLFSPAGGEVGEFEIEKGFAIAGRIKLGDALDANLDFHTDMETFFLLDFDMEANVKEALMKQIKKIKPIAPVMKKVLSTFEVRQIQLHLEANNQLVMAGATHCKFSVFDKPIEFEWKGKFDGGAMIDEMVNKVKEEGLGKVAEVSKKVTAAVGNAAGKSKEIASKAFNEATELAKTASKHATHTQKECDSKCVPDFANKLSKPLYTGSELAVDKFYENVINELVNIASDNDQETRQFRSEYVKTEWDQLCKQIDDSWENIISKKDYTRFYILQSSAENGGKIYRKLVRGYKDRYIAHRNYIWEKMMNANAEDAKEVELKGEKVPDGIYYIQSAMSYGKSNKGFLEFPGKNPAWAKNGNAMDVWTKDDNPNKKFYFQKRIKSPYYNILSGEMKYRKFAIDCQGGKTSKGTVLQSNQENYVVSQLFYLKHLGNGVFKIYNADGKIVALKTNQNNENGNKVHLWDDHNSTTAQWVLINAKTGQKYVP